MSEDFDREAEKEKLREQLEAEEESRRATQHMSELLLKGATMTNKHCDECGDPVFRHEGQEFCPTCQRPVGDGEAAEEAAPDTAEGTAEETAEGADGADAAGTVEVETVDAPAENGEAAPDAGAGETPDAATRAGTERAEPAAPPAPTAEGDLDEAHEALVRTLTDLARRAEATDDLGRTRDLLAATREAAEALSAVRDAGR